MNSLARARLSARSLVALAILVVLTLTSLELENYIANYVILISIIISQAVLSKEFTFRIISLYLLGYLGVALLNISEYRNYISIDTIHLYIISTAFFFFPFLLFKETTSSTAPTRSMRSITWVMIHGHLVIAWLAVFYVYVRHGIVAINQDERFGVPTALVYTIRSTLFIPLYIAMCGNSPKNKYKLSIIFLASIIPSLLIASRSTVALGIFALALYIITIQKYGWAKKIKISIGKRKRITLIAATCIACYSVITLGFYVRRANTDQLMSGSEYVSNYFYDYPKPLMMAIAPIHHGFNETAALTSRVVDRDITNTFTETPLVFADFDNLLGRSDISAPQFFGDSIGRTQDGGLTPGLLGALLLDYRRTYFVWFVGIGFLFAILRRLSWNDRGWLCIYVVSISQMIHLFHRGFIKPEYISTFLISIIYVFSTKRETQPLEPKQKEKRGFIFRKSRNDHVT